MKNKFTRCVKLKKPDFHQAFCLRSRADYFMNRSNILFINQKAFVFFEYDHAFYFLFKQSLLGRN